MTGPWYQNVAGRQYIPNTGDLTAAGRNPEHIYFNYGAAPAPPAPTPGPIAAPAPAAGIAAADPYAYASGRNTQFTGNVPSQTPAFAAAAPAPGPTGANGFAGGAGSPAAPAPSPTAAATGFGPGANVYGGTGVTRAGAMSPLGLSYGTHIDAEGNMHNALTGNPIQGAASLVGGIAGPITSTAAGYLAGRAIQPATLADLGDRTYSGRMATFRDAISDPAQFSSREVDAAKQFDQQQQRAVPTPVQGDAPGPVAVAAESQEGGGNTSGGDHAGNSSGGPGMTGSRSWGGNGTMGSGSGGIGSAARGGMIGYADGGRAFPYSRNRQYVRPNSGGYDTKLSPAEEAGFRDWVAGNNVPFDPDAGVGDYDMRGFYRGLMAKDPHAMTAIDPNDSRLHYTDWWKTPHHETFSNGSQWATPDAPHWTDDDKLIDNSGAVLFDDRAPRSGIDAYARGGLVASATPGRADAIHTMVEKGTYVVPADVVSAMGQGNTQAGAKALEAIHGRQSRHPGYRSGGMVPVRLSGGEFKVHPAVVMHLGNGSIDAGARRLDGLVAAKRQEAMNHLATAPGPR